MGLYILWLRISCGYASRHHITLAGGLPGNVEDDEALQVWQRYAHAVTLELHALVEVLERLVHDLLAANDAIPAQATYM